MNVGRIKRFNGNLWGEGIFYPIIYFHIAMNNTALVVVSFTAPKNARSAAKLLKIRQNHLVTESFKNKTLNYM